MADVVINIRGRADDFNSAVDSAKQKVREMSEITQPSGGSTTPSGPGWSGYQEPPPILCMPGTFYDPATNSCVPVGGASNRDFKPGGGSSDTGSSNNREWSNSQTNNSSNYESIDYRSRTRAFHDELTVNDPSLTYTQRAQKLREFTNKTKEERQLEVKSDYTNIRQSNLKDFQEVEAKFKAGKMTKEEFEKEKSMFDEAQKTSFSSEKAELVEIEKEMNQTLRDILRELVEQRRIDREQQKQSDTEEQRDSDEFTQPGRTTSGGGGGGSGGGSGPNPPTDPDDNTPEGKKRQSRRESQYRGINAASSLTRNVAAGNVEGAVDDSGSALASAGLLPALSKLGPWGLAAYAGYKTVTGVMNSSDALRESLGSVSSMRLGMANTGAQAQSMIRESTYNNPDGILSKFGLGPEDMAPLMREKAISSGKGNNLAQRTLEDVVFRKGFGAETSVFNQFERSEVAGRGSTQIASDILNVLTSIERSSLKESDLTTLTEKLNNQSVIMSVQRSRRDTVDSDKALQIMSAFERVGVSKMGEKGGDFMGRFLTSLGEGGNDNLMLLKYQAAMKADPSLAGDPAKLRETVKFGSDDPKYIQSFMKEIGEMTKNNPIAKQSAIYNIFNPKSKEEYDEIGAMMDGSMKDPEFFTRKLDKTMKASLSPQQMTTDAASQTGAMTEISSQLSNWWAKTSTDLTKMFENNNAAIKDVTENGALKVSVVKDDTKSKPAQGGKLPPIALPKTGGR